MESACYVVRTVDWKPQKPEKSASYAIALKMMAVLNAHLSSVELVRVDRLRYFHWSGFINCPRGS